MRHVLAAETLHFDETVVADADAGVLVALTRNASFTSLATFEDVQVLRQVEGGEG